MSNPTNDPKEPQLWAAADTYYACESCGRSIPLIAVCNCKDKRYSEVQLQREKIKARIDERDKLCFVNKDGTENALPYLQYRFRDGRLLLDWEERDADLQDKLNKLEGK